MASTTTLPHDRPDRAPPGAARTDRSRPGGPTGKRRDALLDNAKFLLIVLVVVGHTIEPLTDTRLGNAVYYWIYLFHMPAFVLISGYLSKSFDGSPRRIDKLLTTIAAPYVIFWGVYALVSLAVGRDLPGGPLDPLWLTWFLAALFVWRLTVPVWQRLRWPFAVAVGVSLLGGLVGTGEVLSVSRIMSLLPFFVAGLLLEPHHFAFLRQTWVRVWAAITMAATAVVCYVYLEQLSREWVYWRESLADRDMDLLPVGIPGRLLFLVLAFALTAAVLSLTPGRTTHFTRLGALTMYVYLLHGLFVRGADALGYYDAVAGLLGDHGALALTGVLSVGLAYLLCTPWVRRATSWAVEPRVDWLLRRDRGSARRDGAGTPAAAPGERAAR
ncbi:acyltransferase family protein [Streptomonospora nanhaiensis]|uniref:Fucose 4-O-acetylase-like acetyltransferase n=1 Tax=Streptomonospora nanhaiensis TaxID=1323731 RepID=A0A853BNI3_9ACTN|nr:acyltransferase family protein [Streptomonospora nanhaiensis]MBX9391024.1 acyltransferase family protein [Streptomonospora nanhaiensis]NYI96012.1 fucose 4-O-acetylase-like acetyltransferase [Streptomonospora nanhaiensis]